MRPSRPYMNGHMRPNNNNNNGFFQRPLLMMNFPNLNQPWFGGQIQNQMMQSHFRGPNPMNMNRMRPLMQDPVHHLQTFPPMLNGPQRGKRPMRPDDDNESKRKKAKLTDYTSTDEQYIVPCSEGTDKITVSIWEYFLNSKMSDEDLEKKLTLQKTLHSIIKEAFPDSRLYIVGSSMTGFATRTSDVDMCLVVSDKEIDQRREAPVILTALLKALRSCSFVLRPLVIRAKVPILKFTDKISGFECDININNTIGIRNTHLLRYYAHLDWRVRPLMIFIKKWARFHDINDASKKTISSYSLSLMLLHYLQAGPKSPVLPCLQSLKPKLFTNKTDVSKLSLKIEKIDFTSTNKSTLGELFLGFLDYYSNLFSYDTEIISVRRGRKISHNDVDYSESDWKFLCIEEPFDGTNTARSVYDHFVFMRILRVFYVSFDMLEKHRETSSILQCPF